MTICIRLKRSLLGWFPWGCSFGRKGLTLPSSFVLRRVARLLGGGEGGSRSCLSGFKISRPIREIDGLLWEFGGYPVAVSRSNLSPGNVCDLCMRNLQQLLFCLLCSCSYLKFQNGEAVSSNSAEIISIPLHPEYSWWMIIPHHLTHASSIFLSLLLKSMMTVQVTYEYWWIVLPSPYASPIKGFSPYFTSWGKKFY